MVMSTASGDIRSPYGVEMESIAWRDNYRPLHANNPAYNYYTAPAFQGQSF